MWRNWNPCALLEKIENDASAIQNHMGLPQKLNTELSSDQIRSVQSLSHVRLFATP